MRAAKQKNQQGAAVDARNDGKNKATPKEFQDFKRGREIKTKKSLAKVERDQRLGVDGDTEEEENPRATRLQLLAPFGPLCHE